MSEWQVVLLVVAAVVMVRSISQTRTLLARVERLTEMSIRLQARLDERPTGRIIPPQGGSGTAPPQSRKQLEDPILSL